VEGDGTMTWRQLWAGATTQLGDRAEARWICEEASGTSGAGWLDVLDQPAGAHAVAELDAMIGRREMGEPIQYVLGHWPFRGLDLLVDRRVLIPRPETEVVAGAAIEAARSFTPSDLDEVIVVVDLGTGSGAIGLAVAEELPLEGTAVWLTEASSEALDVARANLAGIGRSAANVRIAEGSWFDALAEQRDLLRHGVHVVVSNPPYVEREDPRLDASVFDWEPGTALFAGDDGLDAIRIIVGEARDWLVPGGALVLEIGCDQGARCSALAREAGFVGVEVRRDAAGLDRMLVARNPR
jgi:release factor glutamine methyltransferase